MKKNNFQEFFYEEKEKQPQIDYQNCSHCLRRADARLGIFGSYLRQFGSNVIIVVNLHKNREEKALIFYTRKIKVFSRFCLILAVYYCIILKHDCPKRGYCALFEAITTAQ